jgi:hypothetical protein
MPTASQPQESKERNQRQRDELKAIIGRHVSHTLKDDSGLCRVQVRPLWGNFYRVNVLVEEQTGSVKIPHSFFLEADGDGNIIESTPKIPRLSVART